MTRTKMQQLLLDDGCPEFLIRTKSNEQRFKDAWTKHALVTLPAFADPRLEASREMRAQQKKEATLLRITKMKASLEKKKRKKLKIDFSGLHWNVNSSKWIDVDTNTTVNVETLTQETNMARLIITPYGAAGEIIARGLTSIKEGATQQEIDAQIAHSYKRGGAKRVVRVEVTDKNGQPVCSQLFLPDDSMDSSVPASDPATVAAPQPAGPEETEMAKKKAPVKRNGVTKVDTVIAMCERKTGCTLKEIIEKLSVTKAAAAALIGDVRRVRKSLKRDKNTNGDSVYSLA